MELAWLRSARGFNEKGWFARPLLGRRGSRPIPRAPLGVAHVTVARVSGFPEGWSGGRRRGGEAWEVRSTGTPSSQAAVAGATRAWKPGPGESPAFPGQGSCGLGPGGSTSLSVRSPVTPLGAPRGVWGMKRSGSWQTALDKNRLPSALQPRVLPRRPYLCWDWPRNPRRLRTGGSYLNTAAPTPATPPDVSQGAAPGSQGTVPVSIWIISLSSSFVRPPAGARHVPSGRAAARRTRALHVPRPRMAVSAVQ